MKKYLHLSGFFLLSLLMSFTGALPFKTASGSTTYSGATTYTSATTYGGTTTAIDYPVWISAPSIMLSSPIQKVGVTTKGEMAVPSGKTNNVGWYKNGVLPGDTGTAVLDAHVFAAFKNLSKIPVGGDIYISMASGKTLHFKVTDSNLYPLKNLSSTTLFETTSSKQINLITCAGTYLSRIGTYDHRIIVSAELI